MTNIIIKQYHPDGSHTRHNYQLEGDVSFENIKCTAMYSDANVVLLKLTGGNTLFIGKTVFENSIIEITNEPQDLSQHPIPKDTSGINDLKVTDNNL